MSLTQDIVSYVATNSALVNDDTIYVGAETSDVGMDGCVVVREVPGSIENWSGMEGRMIQVLAKHPGYAEAEALLKIAFDLLANKPGFASIISALYARVVGRPGYIDRDANGNFVFSATLLFQREG